MAAPWQLTKQSAGSASDSPKHPCLSNPPSLASCHFPKFVSIRHPYLFDRSIHGSALPAHRGLEHGKGRLDLVDVKLQHPWAPIVGAPRKSSKASESGTNAPSPSTIRLSKYNNQSRDTSPFRPNHNLDRVGWRSSQSSPFARPASLPFSLPTIYCFFIEIPVPFSLHKTDLIPPFRFVARETGPTKIPLPSSTARYLRVYGIVSIMRLGVNSI